MKVVIFTAVTLATIGYFGLVASAYADNESVMNQATWYRTVRMERPQPFRLQTVTGNVFEGRNAASRVILEPYIQNSIEQDARSR